MYQLDTETVTKMDGQVKEIVEVQKHKPAKTLPVPYTTKARHNLTHLQKAFKKKTGGSISLKAIACRLLETATLPE